MLRVVMLCSVLLCCVVFCIVVLSGNCVMSWLRYVASGCVMVVVFWLLLSSVFSEGFPCVEGYRRVVPGDVHQSRVLGRMLAGGYAT